MNTQNTETPDILVRALEDFLGINFKYDMAGDEQNKKAPIVFTEEHNSLRRDWPMDGWCFLNPPFAKLTLWVKKCKEQSARGVPIVSIWPLSGDLNQVDTWMGSRVHIIHRRIWKGVRGCMVCVWGASGIIGLMWDGKKLTEIWR